jgi:hypothetical protein
LGETLWYTRKHSKWGRKLPRQADNRKSRRQNNKNALQTSQACPFLVPVLEPLVFVRNYIRYRSSLYTCPGHGTTSSSSYHDIPAYEFRTARMSLPALPLRRTVAQAVSRRLPKAAARVRAQVKSCGICGGQSGIGAGFLRVFRFPLPIRIAPIAPQSSSSIIWGSYNKPNSGRSTKWTQSHPTRK